MIGRLLPRFAGALRAAAAWVDFGVALLVACVERVRLRDVPVVAEPRLVAQAITVDGELAVVRRLEPGRGGLSVGPAATAAIAAVALASTLGAGSLFSFGFGEHVATMAGDPVVRTLGSTHHRATSIVPGSTSQDVAGTSAPAQILEMRKEREELSLSAPFVSAGDVARTPPPSEVELIVPAAIGVWFEANSEPAATREASGPRASAFAESPAGVSVATPEEEGEASSTDVPAPAEDVVAAVPLARPASAGIPEALPAFSGLTYTESEVRSLALEAGWAEEHLDDLVLIAWCESRLMPDARGAWALGLMQVMPFWFDVAGEDIAQWSNPVTNLKVALVAFKSDIARGLDPWAAWQCLPVGRVTAAGE